MTRDPIRQAVLADRASLRAEYRRRIASCESMAQQNEMPLLKRPASESARNVADHLERIERHWREADRKARKRSKR